MDEQRRNRGWKKEEREEKVERKGEEK